MPFSSGYGAALSEPLTDSFGAGYDAVSDQIPGTSVSAGSSGGVLGSAGPFSSGYFAEVLIVAALLPAKQIRSATFTNAQVDRVFDAASIDAGKLNLAAGGGLKDSSDQLAIEPADFAGTGLTDDGADNIAIDTATGSVTFTGGTWTFPVDVLQVTGTPDSANDAVNKSYVDGLVTGIAWKEPVLVTDFIGERTITQIDALTPAAGWAVVATDAGTPSAGTSDALAAGDLAEFDGTSWIKLYSNAAGQLPSGIRLIVAEPGITLFSPLTGSADEGKILVSVATPGTFNGTNSDFEDTSDAVDGNAVLVQGPEAADAESVNENLGYVFDGAVPTGTWIQFTGAGQINAGAGLSKTGNTLNIGDINRGVQVNADDLEIAASEASFATGGIEASSNSWQFQIKTHGGALGEALTTDANGLNVNGDVIDITFNPTNYTPDITGNPGGATDIDDLAAHLLGIDNAIAASGGTPRQESLTTQNITGTDTALTDTLNFTPTSDASVKLYLNGILQKQGATFDYTISGSTITWLANTGTAVDMDTNDELIAVYES